MKQNEKNSLNDRFANPSSSTWRSFLSTKKLFPVKNYWKVLKLISYIYIYLNYQNVSWYISCKRQYLTHLCPPLRSTFAVRETDVSLHNGGTSGAPLKPLRDDSAQPPRALSSLSGLRWAPALPPLCRETQSLGQQMLELSCENATVGTNGLIRRYKQTMRNGT